MAFGDLALGLASVLLGLHQIRTGARRLQGLQGTNSSGFAASRGLAATRSFDVFAPTPRATRSGGMGANQPFMDSGRSLVNTRSGRVPMQMRSYNIRTLDDRISHLRRLVDEGKRDPRVYAFARRSVTKRCGNKWCVPEKDNLGETKALFSALRGVDPRDLGMARQVFGNQRRNVRYTSDIMGVDTYQKPAHTIALRSGDCDDYSSLACSSLGSLGIPCRFKVIRTKGAKDWNHIYAQAGLPRSNPTHWISMDSSVNMPFGWEAPARMVAASRTFRVT